MHVNRIHALLYRIRVTATVVGLGFLLIAAPAAGQAFSPYGDFLFMSLSDLETLQVKLTWIGSQERTLRTLAFTSASHTFDVSEFDPYRRPGVSYANDLLMLRTFDASATELQAILMVVSLLPNVTAGLEDPNGDVSFALFNSAGGDKGFEAILNIADTVDLLAALRTGLASNADGLRMVNERACHYGALEPGSPTDSTADLTLVFEGFREQSTSGKYVNRVKVTNTSGGAIASPISIVFDLPALMQLTNANGFTCGTSPQGRDYIDLPGSLAPGASVELDLEFENLAREDLQLRPLFIYSGPGAR